MPQISKVGDGWAGLEDYATLGAWWATESAIDYGAPIEAACKGNFGAGETISGTSVNGAIAYTDSVIFDGTNESLLAVCDRLTVSVTNPLTLNDLIIRTTNQYVFAFSLSSDTVTSNRCVFDNQTAGVGAISINGLYPNTNINNFVARGGLDTINAGYLRGTNFNKGLVYGATGFGVNGSAGAGNFVLTDVFAFSNVTDYDTANLTLNNCASQDLTGSAGLTGYTSAELVDFANGDYRVKSTSPLATAGTIDFIGAFVEASGGTVTYNITVPFSASYDVYNKATNTTLMLYDVYNSVDQQVTVNYDVYSSIVQSLSVSYDIYNKSLNELSIAYGVYNSASLSLTSAYDIYNSVIADFLFSYDVYNKVTSSISVSYASYNATDSQLFVLYDININTANVVSSLSVTYDIYNAVSSQVTAYYDVYNKAVNSTTVIYSVYNNLSEQITLSYDVYNSSAISVGISYDVYNKVESQTVAIYDVYTAVSLSLSSAYSIYNSATNGVSALYSVYNKINTDLRVYYDIGDVVADERLVAKRPFIVQNKRKSFSIANARRTFN